MSQQEQNANDSVVYSVVIIDPRGPNTGTVSRAHGTDITAALAQAHKRLSDFPNCAEVRLVSPGCVHASLTPTDAIGA